MIVLESEFVGSHATESCLFHLRRWLLLLLMVFGLSMGCGGERSPGDSSGTDPISQSNTHEKIALVLELEALYPEAFSFLNGVRQLPEGTVLAADPLAQILLRIDLDAGTADTLGRVGPGPQEYQQPDGVFALPGDSTLLVDLGKMTLSVVTPQGALRDATPMRIPTNDAIPVVFTPRFVDARGNLYDEAGRSRDRGPPDSVAILRFDRATRTLDTVAMVWRQEYRQTRSRGRGFLPRMLQPSDAWAAGADGRLVIIHASDFSVEWRFPDGRRVSGPPHSFRSYPVRRRDKETILAEARSSGISSTIAVSPTEGVLSMTMRRGLPSTGEAPGIDEFEWAETFPPFRPEGARVSPGGEVWVERWLPTGSDSRWEIFDEDGRWEGSVVLPPGHRLIGFSQGPDDGEVVYLTRTDEYDLKWLGRYRVVR